MSNKVDVALQEVMEDIKDVVKVDATGTHFRLHFGAHCEHIRSSGWR